MNGKWRPGASETILRGMAQRYAPMILVHGALIVVWYPVVKFSASCFLFDISGWRSDGLYPLAGGGR
jgi:hypothetical protein